MIPPPRTLFVNSGMLGHASVAHLVRHAADAAGIPGSHVDLAAGLTRGERVVRRLLCAGPASGASFPGAALLLPRPRHELHAGIQAARRIRALERRGGAWDVLHFHTQAAAYGSVPRMRRTPTVVSIDATQPLAAAGAAYAGAGVEYGISARLDRRVFRAAAAVVSVSEWAAASVRRELPEGADRVHVLPYPAPLDRFPAGWATERSARRADVATVLFVGGDFPRKGGVELLDAWRAAGIAAHARLVLVTDWPLGALPAGVEQRRGVRAYTPEWSELWRAAALFVLPSRDEAFGMVFQEAAAAGLPAIGTRVNALPELVEDGVTGVLVPPRDRRALAAALRALVDAPGRRAAMGRAARARAERLWSPADYASGLAEVLRGAVARREVRS